MDHLTQAVESALQQENWYAALSLSLTLPDICSKIDEPDVPTSQRFPRWVDEYFTPGYTRMMPSYSPERGAYKEEHVFLSGRDFYALRCAVLHEGSDSILNQRAREALESFTFVAPQPGLVVHRNQAGAQLQLQVDKFCADVCDAVSLWTAQMPVDSVQYQRVNGLMKITKIDLTNGFSF